MRSIFRLAEDSAHIDQFLLFFNVIHGYVDDMHPQPLDQRPPLPGHEAVAVAAAVAAALGELHEAGLVHGGLGPDHVLVDEVGGVTLVPARDSGSADVQPSDDVAALGRLLTWLAERAPDRPARPSSSLLGVPHPTQLLADLGHRCLATAADRPSARVVADTLHRRLPDARPLLSPRPSRRPKLGSRATVGSVVAVALVGAVVAPARCTSPAATAESESPPGAEAVRWVHGVLTVGSHRYAVGEPGDDVLVDGWECGPSSVALLRRSTGEVVAFDRFPEPGRPATGRVLGRVPDALRLVRRFDRCATLAVATTDGRTVPLAWKEAS